MNRHIHVKTKHDLKEYQAILDGTELASENRYETNLIQLIEDALSSIPRDDINLGSDAGKKLLANHVGKRMLALSKEKDWWDMFHYLF